MKEAQLNFDITKTQPILTKEGGKIWQSGFLLRKASRFLTQTDQDSVIPIPIFYCAETGEINREGMPPGTDFLFEDEK